MTEAVFRDENGWRFYRVNGGEIGTNKLRRPKFYPEHCRLNSTWLSREEAARMLREWRRDPQAVAA